MVVYSRVDWGAMPPRSPLAVASTPGDSLVVHHTGGGAAPSSVEDACAMLRGIQASHQNGEYSDIAYNMAVDNFGNIYTLRGMDMVGAATYGHNHHTRAVVWLGNSDVSPPSAAALQAIAALYKSQVGVNLTADASITGHRDWVATACPGETLYSQLDTVRSFAFNSTTVTPTPIDPEEDVMYISWACPDGTRYVLNRDTGISVLFDDMYPAESPAHARLDGFNQLCATGVIRDIGVVGWEANWVLRTSRNWVYKP